jgi:hypothetical protein
MQVAVALVGNPDSGLIEDDDWQRPWGERTHVQLDVREDESLASVVERAFEALGVRLPEWASSFSAAYPFVGFDAEGTELRVSSSLDVIDDSGRIIWNVYDFDAIPYDQLVSPLPLERLEAIRLVCTSSFSPPQAMGFSLIGRRSSKRGRSRGMSLSDSRPSPKLRPARKCCGE